MGAHGSTTAGLEFEGCCQVSFAAGALLSQGSGCSDICGAFESHGSLSGAGLDVKFPFCSQASFGAADATDGDCVREIQASTLLALARADVGCFDIAPVFDCHGSTAGDERPQGSGA